MNCNVTLNNSNNFQVATTSYKIVPIRLVTIAIIKAGLYKTAPNENIPDKIQAIKNLRDACLNLNLGLLEAKNIIEKWWDMNGGFYPPTNPETRTNDGGMNSKNLIG